METGIDTAKSAAEGILQSDPVLGGICILLAISLVSLLIFHFKEAGRLNKELLDSERQHGKDALQTQSSVTTALATVQQAIAIISAKGGR